MSKLPAPLNKLPLPIIGSPLFIISNPKLVIAQCIAGIVGAMPALNARPAAQLEEWLIEITETLAAYNKANPDNLPESDPSAMNFGGDKTKAWKDIWGCGQGIGAVTKVQSAAAFVAQLRREYNEAKARL